MKILIVEDSRTQAERLKNILEENGYEICIAVNGQDALNKLNEFKPDLVISDILMPEMDGYDVCKRIRLNPDFKNITFILLSTLSDVEDIISGLESGANFIITKPYNDEHLLKYLHNAINIQKIRQSEKESKNVKILVNGNEHTINAKKSQIIDFLISIYDAAVLKNKELYSARLQLQELNNMLERKVEERTDALRVQIEERKRYEQQFIEAQKLESIGKLTGGIAHDFNNLLLIVQGNLEILAKHLKQDSNEIKNVNQALIALDRGTALIKRLLSFARKQALFPKNVDICEYLPNVISLLKTALSERITITTSYVDHLWPIWVDPVQLEAAIMNIVINARDAMLNRGIIHFDATNITIDDKNLGPIEQQMEPGDYVKISISDQGVGMTHEIIEHIFEPFFTTKKVGEGTGLGLSMVYGFIKQSNGSISVDSKVSQGTTFNLYFPRSNIIDETKVELKINSNISLKGNEVILITEDEIAVSNLVSTYLNELGYQVLTASTAQEALEIIKSAKHIDLLFTDIIMSGDLTGPELATEAKKIIPQIKILLTSGYARDTLTNREQVPSDMQYLMKPYKLEALATKMRLILDTSDSSIVKMI